MIFFEKKNFALFVMCCLPVFCFSQNSVLNTPDISYRRSFIVPHHKSIQYLAKGFVNSYEINFCVKSDTNALWYRAHRKPFVGFGLCFSDFNNPKILGNSLSGYFFIRRSLHRSRNWGLNIRFAEGISRISTHFDPYTNVTNNVIGSHFNVYVFLGFEVQKYIGRHIVGSVGCGFTHYSNGAIKIPNKGINLMGLTTSVRMKKTQDADYEKQNLPEKPNIRKYLVIISGGFHQLNDWGQKYYGIASASVEYQIQKRHTFAYGIGGDAFFDEALLAKPLSDSIYHVKKQDFLYPGVHLSGDYIFGNVSLTMQFGAYIGAKPYTYQYVYSRFGLRYNISDHILANISLKTYFAAADFIEFGIGYSFLRNK